ncbi:hypothetical protein KP509_27G066600 [Ceratopteris richardii]|uniref:Transmembrane protein n=2 Tax=Ceratopteris richardii TaxID=49495 RepID=A0A8T2RIM9_CERRI|nr:hypothetical protein KP509_27G066600 [Ceratopteris richardii]
MQLCVKHLSTLSCTPFISWQFSSRSSFLGLLPFRRRSLEGFEISQCRINHCSDQQLRHNVWCAYHTSAQETSKRLNGESKTQHHRQGALEEDPTPMRDHRPFEYVQSSMVLEPSLPPSSSRIVLALPQQAYLLLGVLSVSVCGAFIFLIGMTIPTLNAMRRAAMALERLADTAREELPSTMAAIRLSGMEISDLTLELSDLSQELSESVSTARAVRAAKVGMQRMGSASASQTLSMLQEHASIPVEAVKPVVASAAQTTVHAMSQAHKVVSALSGMPILSKWIQKRKSEEQNTAGHLDSPFPSQLDEENDQELINS